MDIFQQSIEVQVKLEEDWNLYWKTWDDELRANLSQRTSWSPFVLKTYRSYRQDVEVARKEAVRKMQELHVALKTKQNQKDEVRNNTVKVRKMTQELEIANIEARHSQERGTKDSETRKTNLKQNIAEAKHRFAKTAMKWKEDQQREQEVTEKDLELAKEMIESDFFCAHIQAWQDFVAADDKNANGDRDRWPRYPPALMIGFINNNDFDVLNGYSPL